MGSDKSREDVVGDETVVSVDDTVIAAEDTIIASDDTVIAVDDTVMRVSADETIIEPDVEDTALGAHPKKDAPEVLAADEKNIDLAPTQPLRRVPDRPAAPPRQSVAFSLRFVTGARYELTSAVVVGRSPRLARLDKSDAVQLVTVPSREGRVSSTHAELRQVGDVVVLTDLRSTNGTRVTMPGGVIHQLAPGDSMTLGAGAVVDIGDGNRIDVMRDKTS